MIHPSSTSTRTDPQSAASKDNSSTVPASLTQAKRSFSWPGSLPGHQMNMPSPSFLTTLNPLTIKTTDRTKVTVQDSQFDKNPLWDAQTITTTAPDSSSKLGLTTMSQPHSQPSTLAIQTASPAAAQLPAGTPLLYQVASPHGFGVRQPMFTPILTVLSPSLVNQAATAGTPSPQQVILAPSPGLNVPFLAQQAGAQMQSAEKQLKQMTAITTVTDSQPMPEPSTGQSITSPMIETVSVSGCGSPPKTLASIPPQELTPAYSELKVFAEEFKTKRIRLGYTQGAVGQSLADKGYSNFAQSTISRFEQMQLSPTNAAAIKQVLKKWLQDAESPSTAHSSSNNPPSMTSRKRKKRAVFTPQTRTTLEEFFKQNPRPNRHQIEAVAQQLDLLPEEVRVWFCNKRQKEKQQHGIQVVYPSPYEKDTSFSATSSGANSPPSLYDPPHRQRSTPSPKTSFTIEELSKSSTTSSISSSPVRLTSPFAMSPTGGITTTAQRVIPLLVSPSPPSFGPVTVNPFVPTTAVAQTKA